MLASTAFGFVFAVLWLRDRGALHFGLWALSSLIYGAGILLFSLMPTAPLYVILALYGLIAVTDVLPLSGVFALEGQRIVRPWMVLPILSAIVGHASPILLTAAGLIEPRAAWQTLGDAGGLFFAMGVPGWVLAFGRGARASVGRRMAGIAMLGYLPAYLLAIVGEFLAFPNKELVALTAMLSDQVLLGVLNLGLLAIPVERVQRQLRTAALKDALTGCWNRAGLAVLASSYCKPGAVVLALDVDHFKQINDLYGHAAGDDVLAFIGAEATALGQELDGQVVRQGGDEFVLLLPAHAVEPSRFAALLQSRLSSGGRLGTGWTVSLGSATVRASDASLDEAIARADAALYQAKSQRQLCRQDNKPLLTLAG